MQPGTVSQKGMSVFWAARPGIDLELHAQDMSSKKHVLIARVTQTKRTSEARNRVLNPGLLLRVPQMGCVVVFSGDFVLSTLLCFLKTPSNCCLAVPPTVILVTKLGEFRRNILQWTDKRVGFMNEIINGMQMIKFYAVSLDDNTCFKPRSSTIVMFCLLRSRV